MFIFICQIFSNKVNLMQAVCINAAYISDLMCIEFYLFIYFYARHTKKKQISDQWKKTG